MNRTLIACIITISIAQCALAINPASEAWKEKIQNQINIGISMDDEVYAAQENLDNAKSGQATPASIRQLELELQRTKDRQMAAYTKAIHQTIEAYGLEPRSRQGTSVTGRTAGREIHWIPVAGEQPTRFIQGSDGKFGETVRTPISWAGRTFIDGVSYINPETIKMGPEFIATTVLHERIHFEQYTTRGRGDKMSSAERELEANKAERANIDSFFEPTSEYRQYAETRADDLIAIHQRKVDEERAGKRGFPGVVNRYFPNKPNPDFDDATPHAPAKLAELKRQSDDFEAEIRRESQRLVSKSRKVAALEAANPPKKHFWETGDTGTFQRRMAELKKLEKTELSTGYIPPPPFSRAFGELKAFALQACHNPDTVIIDKVLVPYYDTSYRGFDDAVAENFTQGMDACARQLFYKVIDLIRSNSWEHTDRNWLRIAVANYSRPLAIDPPVTGGSRGERREPRDRSAPSGDPYFKPPPPVRHDPEGVALRQLQEAERRKRWGLRPYM